MSAAEVEQSNSPLVQQKGESISSVENVAQEGESSSIVKYVVYGVIIVIIFLILYVIFSSSDDDDEDDNEGYLGNTVRDDPQHDKNIEDYVEFLNGKQQKLIQCVQQQMAPADNFPY